MALLHILPTDNAQTPQPISPSNPIPTTPGASVIGTASATAGNKEVSLTRTSDTNAYTANDVIGAATGSTAALTFSSMGRPAGGNIIITSAQLFIYDTALISGEASYDLHLYNITPPSALGDNAAFDLPSGDRASYKGKITLGTPVDLGSTLVIETDAINKQVPLLSDSLFAYLVTSGAYTPTSARVYQIKLRSVVL